MSWQSVLSLSLSLSLESELFLTASSLFVQRPQGEEERDRRTDGRTDGRRDGWIGEWIETEMKGRGPAVSLEFRPESVYKSKPLAPPAAIASVFQFVRTIMSA